MSSIKFKLKSVDKGNGGGEHSLPWQFSKSLKCFGGEEKHILPNPVEKIK